MANSAVHPPPQISIPPLQNGDRLTRDEFERRYAAMPNIKAELIEGVVYMASPVNLRDHGEPQFNLMGWLAAYRSFTSPAAIRAGDNATVRLNLKNEPQ